MNAGTPADPLDLRILEALQQDIPLVARPWEAIAARLGIPETVLYERLERLRQEGILRGISPIVESRPLGIAASTLVALPVAEGKIHEVAAIISSYCEVSHNFRRDDPYSLWFTLSAADDDAVSDLLQEILLRTGVSREEILDLRTVRRLKIDVRFPLAGARNGGQHGQP